MTLRTRHSIELLNASPQAALLAVILMTTLVERKSEESKLGNVDRFHDRVAAVEGV